MSTPDNPFEQLILPTQVPSAWPPAPIYWFLGLLVITVIGLAIFFVKRHIKQQLIIKQALFDLQLLQQNNASFADLNQLLKAIMLCYYPRAQVASLTGKAWFAWLEKHATDSTALFENIDAFEQRLYQGTSIANEQDFSAAKIFITSLPKQILALQKEQQSGEDNA